MLADELALVVFELVADVVMLEEPVVLTVEEEIDEDSDVLAVEEIDEDKDVLADV